MKIAKMIITGTVHKGCENYIGYVFNVPADNVEKIIASEKERGWSVEPVHGSIRDVPDCLGPLSRKRRRK